MPPHTCTRCTEPIHWRPLSRAGVRIEDRFCRSRPPVRCRWPGGNRRKQVEILQATSTTICVVRKSLKKRRRSSDCPPLHPAQCRSALLTHRAPTSGHDVEPPVGIGVPQLRAEQPTLRDPHHLPPRQPVPLDVAVRSRPGRHASNGVFLMSSPRSRSGSKIAFQTAHLPAPAVPWRIRDSPEIHMMMYYCKSLKYKKESV
jgi:hypothetical protein